jgi:hypothetical protein
MKFAGIEFTMVSRLGLLLLAAIATVAIPVDASATRHKHMSHRHLPARHPENAWASAAPAPETSGANLAPMRYYGGPKSPMWRQ